VGTATVADSFALSDQQIRALAPKRVFFGHKSVGANILEGVRDLMTADSGLKLKIVMSADPSAVDGPALIEAEIGENGIPQSKNAAFAAALINGMGPQGGIAMYKYCYVDITDSTDVPRLFDQYRKGIAALEAAHPDIKFVHITVPLTTVEPAIKAWVKTILGRRTARAENMKRNEFNRMLKHTYAANRIFDLAEQESTRSDGSRAYFSSGSERIYTLADEYTTDGGHLNELGRRAAAKRLLAFLAATS